MYSRSQNAAAPLKTGGHSGHLELDPRLCVGLLSLAQRSRREVHLTITCMGLYDCAALWEQERCTSTASAHSQVHTVLGSSRHPLALGILRGSMVKGFPVLGT